MASRLAPSPPRVRPASLASIRRVRRARKTTATTSTRTSTSSAATSALEYGWMSALRSICGSSWWGGPSLAGALSRSRRTGCYPLPSAARDHVARRLDPPLEARHQIMAKRSRGSTSRPGQRPPLQRQAARPRGRGRRGTRRRAPTRHPDRRRRGARGRARGLDPRRGEGRRGGQEAVDPIPSVDAAGSLRRRAAAAPVRTPPPTCREPRAELETRPPVGHRAARSIHLVGLPSRPRHVEHRGLGRQEYAYVARDVRRIAIVGGGLILILLASGWSCTSPGSASSDRSGTRRSPPARATIGTMPSARRPTGARPEALFQPPPERQPLAARMRPRNLEEFVGQAAPRRRARAAPARHRARPPLVAAAVGTAGHRQDQPGPPPRRPRSAPTSPRCRRSCRASSRSARPSPRPRTGSNLHGTRSILFLDEIHRFNKAQQDALLPHVEDGTVTLIGATTENPYFEVNSALLSRMRVWRLEALTDEEVGAVVRRALDRRGARAGRPARSRGRRRADRRRLRAPRLARRRRRARGAQRPRGRDRRSPSPRTIRDAEGRVSPRLEDVETAAQQRVLAYDRAGDGHYDTVSAFIKSLRGNDPDAALYWLAAMIAAGEDPKFIARRLIISASEDVGNADPRALSVAVAAGQALDWIGLPEAQYALAQATVFIASSPKSDSVGRAYSAALADVDGKGSLPVPNHLRTAGDRRMKHARHRRRLQVPARLRGRRRRAAVPARRAGRSPLLRPQRPGPRGDDRGPHGGPRGGAPGQAAQEEPAEPADGRDERRVAAARGEPQEARRDPEEGRERLNQNGPDRRWSSPFRLSWLQQFVSANALR